MNIFNNFYDSLINLITVMGYSGILIGMTLESACIPIPSEIIMPLGGFMAFEEELNFHVVVLAGTFGNLIGSLIAYYAGREGRAIFERKSNHIKGIHYTFQSLSEKWVSQYGGIAVFLGRLVPGVRTFISFPAGVIRMDIKIFIIYTFIGSYIWCFLLAWLGMQLGGNWENIIGVFANIHIYIAILVLLISGVMIYYWIKKA